MQPRLIPFDGQWLYCQFTQRESKHGALWLVQGRPPSALSGPALISVHLARLQVDPQPVASIMKTLHRLFLLRPPGKYGDYLNTSGCPKAAATLVSQPADEIYRELLRLLVEELPFVRQMRDAAVKTNFKGTDL